MVRVAVGGPDCPPSKLRQRKIGKTRLDNGAKRSTLVSMKTKKPWRKPTLRPVLISLESTAYSATS
jgi:hypothetical protein